MHTFLVLVFVPILMLLMTALYTGLYLLGGGTGVIGWICYLITFQWLGGLSIIPMIIIGFGTKRLIKEAQRELLGNTSKTSYLDLLIIIFGILFLSSIFNPNVWEGLDRPNELYLVNLSALFSIITIIVYHRVKLGKRIKMLTSKYQEELK